MPLEHLQALREKYPQYADIPDQQLASQVVAKYPQYRDILGDVADLGVAGGRNVDTSIAPTPPPKARGLMDEILSAGKGAVKGAWEGTKGLAMLPKTVYDAAVQTPSDIASMVKNPSTIPGVLGQTARNTAEMIPAAAGFAMGGTPGAMLAQGGVDLTRSLVQGQTPNVEDWTSRFTQAGVPNAILSKVLGAAAPRADKITPQGAQLAETAKKAGFEPAVTDVAPGNVWNPLAAYARRQLGGGKLTDQARKEVETMKGSELTGEPGFMAKEAGRVAPESQTTSVARGNTALSGLKQIADENRSTSGMRDYVWEEVKGFDTGKASLPLSNVADVAAEMLHKPAVRQSIIDRASSGRLRSDGGITTPVTEATTGPMESPTGKISSGGTFVTQKMIQGPEAHQSMVEALANNREVPLTFEQMRVLREWVGQRYHEDPVTWGRLFGAVKDDLATGLQKIPGASEAYTRALDYETKNITPFRKGQLLGDLLNQKEPAKVMDQLFQPNDKSVSLLSAVREQTKGKGPTWEALQGEGMARAVQDARLYKSLGPETRKFFTPDQLSVLDTIHNYRTTSTSAGKTLKDFERGTGVLTPLVNQAERGVTLLLSLGGAGVGAHYGSPYTAMALGTAVALTPKAIAFLLTNPKTAQWLKQGFTVPPGTREAADIAGNLARAASQFTHSQDDPVSKLKSVGLNLSQRTLP